MKKSKVDKLVEELSLKELQESIERLSSKDEETIEETEIEKEESGATEKEEEKALPDNLVTKKDYDELNKKFETMNTLVQELMKDKPVGVQRKVVSKATGDNPEQFNVNNVFNNLKKNKY